MIPQDKIAHILAGFTIATVFQFNGWAMVIAVLVAGIGKEVYDKLKGREFGVADMCCTFAGGLLGIVVSLSYGRIAI